MQANQTIQANIVLDTRKAMNRELGDQLSAVIGAVRGVTRARVSRTSSRMVLVDYDPSETDSLHVLGAALAQGYDARLIGM